MFNFSAEGYVPRQLAYLLDPGNEIRQTLFGQRFARYRTELLNFAEWLPAGTPSTHVPRRIPLIPKRHWQLSQP